MCILPSFVHNHTSLVLCMLQKRESYNTLISVNTIQQNSCRIYACIYNNKGILSSFFLNSG